MAFEAGGSIVVHSRCVETVDSPTHQRDISWRLVQLTLKARKGRHAEENKQDTRDTKFYVSLLWC